MQMNTSNCPRLVVEEMFRSLLCNTNPSNSSATSDHRLSSAATSDQRLSVSTTTETLTAPPPKNSIRYIEHDQNNRREKYDGCRWRLVCIWNTNECTNLAYSNQLCSKHNALRRNKELPKRKRKPLFTHTSLPIMNQYNHNNARNNNHQHHNDDDDIQILEDYCIKPIIRHSVNSNIKSETLDFNVFSVEHVDDTDIMKGIKSEPMASSSSRSTTNNDIEYLSSKARCNGLNVDELTAKNLPPLTDFEEEYLANRLMERFPTNCPMLDAQLFLQNEAITVVKKNYRFKMDTVAPEYFYDFLLRHPRVALHYSNWFLRCKPVPPSTGCPIDTKVWTLSMIVRGALNSDRMNDD